MLNTEVIFLEGISFLKMSFTSDIGCHSVHSINEPVEIVKERLLTIFLHQLPFYLGLYFIKKFMEGIV
ncbi:hypothetical protein J43TS3_20040 [Ornithinibacillus bavariensis]|uniref:Uncharacterized protein n=1 Tax=Ornithinibacillus bavariensis TaxID=545502 RepID=A0A919XB77_9BACI|nr:hypothetical protein J43TS3_20040 [Ornithinibacillus bavariensis]